MVARRIDRSSGDSLVAAVRAAVRRRDWLFVTDDAHAGRMLLWLAGGMPAIVAAEFDAAAPSGRRHIAVAVFPRHALGRHNVEHFVRKLGRPSVGAGWLVPISDHAGELMGAFLGSILGCDNPGPVRPEGRW